MIMMVDDKIYARLSFNDDNDDSEDDDDDDHDEDDDDDDDATHAGSSPQTGPEDLISGYCSHFPV